MGLQYEISLEDFSNVDESLKSLYRENEEGNYVLDVEDVKHISEIGKLQEALRKERVDHKGTKLKLKNYEGINIEEYEALKNSNVVDGNDDEIKTKKLERRIEDLELSLQNVSKEKETLRNSMISSKRNSKIAELALKIGVVPTAIKDVQYRAERELEFDDSDNQFYSKEGVTLNDWLNKQKEDNPHWLPQSFGGGSKGNNASIIIENPFKSGNLTEQSKLFKENPTKYHLLKKQFYGE